MATTVGSQLGVIFPTDIALVFLRDSNPSVRARACACVRAGYEVVATLIAMLNDPDGEVSALLHAHSDEWEEWRRVFI